MRLANRIRWAILPLICFAPYFSSASFGAQPTICQPLSVQEQKGMFEGYIKSPTSNLYLVNRADAKGVFQVYTTVDTVHFTCLTCTQQAGGPNPAKQHLMVSWHPSGQWIVAGVEQNTHDLQWLPESYQLGLMQSGIWLNMWITDVAGDHWHQLTNYTPANGPARGFVGTPFTRDGKTAAWTEIVNGDVLLYPFGQWRLLISSLHGSIGPRTAN